MSCINVDFKLQKVDEENSTLVILGDLMWQRCLLSCSQSPFTHSAISDTSQRGLCRVVGPYENVKYLARRRTSISCCQTLPSSFSAALQDLHDGGTNFKIGILPNVTSQIQKNNTCIWILIRTKWCPYRFPLHWPYIIGWEDVAIWEGALWLKLVWPVLLKGIWFIYQV